MVCSAEYLTVLPEIFQAQLARLKLESLEEIRMRVGQPVCLYFRLGCTDVFPRVEPRHLEEVIQRACHHSAHVSAHCLKEGYLTIEGGHRIGVCGQGVIKEKEVHTIRAPSSLCIRIAKQISGCGEQLLPLLKRSTLILGPPGAGKTTLLRDAVALLSDRTGVHVGLVDERGEIAACVAGVPQLYVGRNTDVLVGVAKDAAIMMLLRSMGPRWIAVDEITAADDILAMEQAAYCGVKLLATAHAESVDDLRRRPLYRQLLERCVFSQAVVLRADRSYELEEIKG